MGATEMENEENIPLIEPIVEDIEEKEMEKEETIPLIMREYIEVVEIVVEESDDEEVDQPAPSGRHQREREEEWTIMRLLDAEPEIDEDDTTLRMRLRIVQRVLFDEPGVRGMGGMGETTSPAEEIIPHIGGLTPMETEQEAAQPEARNEAPPTREEETETRYEAEKEEEVETEEAWLKRKRIREGKNPAKPLKKKPRLANRAVVIQELVKAVRTVLPAEDQEEEDEMELRWPRGAKRTHERIRSEKRHDHIRCLAILARQWFWTSISWRRCYNSKIRDGRRKSSSG